MRVIRLLQALSIALLIMPLISTAAGAIYIPGQEIPNDGLMHIMAADDSQGQSAAASPWSAAGYFSGILPQASVIMPALSLADIQKQIGTISLPYTNSPGLSIGSNANQFVSPGYWESIDKGSLMTNMPVLSIPALY